MERDKLLTETMGRKWHEPVDGYNCHCGSKNYLTCGFNIDFSTWPGYGKLSQFMASKKLNAEFFSWYQKAVCNGHTDYYMTWIESTPDLCANAIYEFLKERH